MTYNYKENIWYFGNMSAEWRRKSCVYHILYLLIILVVFSQHERDYTIYDANPPSAETGIIEIGDGTDKMFIDRIYPDGRSAGSVYVYRLGIG